MVDENQYVVCGDSRYNTPVLIEVTFHGLHLTTYPTAFKKAMSSAHVTFEWFFKEEKNYLTSMDY